jgi:putative heme-binding domain-containing protein
VQSGLYRVTYAGSESAAPAQHLKHNGKPTDADEVAAVRRQLEAFHGKQDPKAIELAGTYLNAGDRFLRWAARTALEHQPVNTWADEVLGGKLCTAEGLLALARCTGVCPQHRKEGAPAADAVMRDRILNSIGRVGNWLLHHGTGTLILDDAPKATPRADAPKVENAAPTPAQEGAAMGASLARLPAGQRLILLRTIEIVLNRFDGCDEPMRQKLIAALDPLFPANTFEENWLLCETLAYLQSPTLAAKGMKLLAEAATQEEQIEYARSLRVLKTGWTKELRTAQLEWLLKAANFRGGASFEKFIEFIRTDVLATFTDTEKKDLAALIEKKPEHKSTIEALGAMFAGRTPKNWTLEELSDVAKTGMKGRSFDNGRKMFGAAACFTCHRFANEGGMTGPDLTQAGGRYSATDLLDNIINPSKVINEQFVPSVVTMEDGTQVMGTIVNLNGDNVMINTDPSVPNQQTAVDRKKVKSIEPSKISPMPPMLLSMLTKEEILDLVAYVLSGGDRENAAFKK